MNRGNYLIPYKEPPERLKQCRTIEGYVRTLERVLKAFPTVTFSLAHTGTAAVMSDYEAIYQVIVDHPNAYCDIAMSTGYGIEWLQELVKTVGPRKVMFGTDWPYWAEGADSYLTGSKRWTMIANECPQFSEKDKRLILAGNAERFLRNELADPDAERTAAPARSQAEKAWNLHRKYPVIVMHDHNAIKPDVSKMLAGGVAGKVYQFSLDVEPCADFRASAAQRDGWAYRALASLEYAKETVQKAPEHVMWATSAGDLEKAHRERKVAIMLGSEGGKLLEGKLEWLEVFYRHKLRELQLTWATPNQIVERSDSTGSGLTEFGREVVRECDRLGIIVCLTHITERAFHEVLDLSERPQILSHEALGVGVNEGMVRKLAAKDGVLGIHFYRTYLGPDPTPEQVVDQVDRIAQVAGIDAVGLGCDFFPTEGPWGDFQRQQGTQDIVWALPGISYMSQVTEALLARDYQEEDIRKVLGGNFLRVCRSVFGA
jgi:membrane dipeptidase